MWWEAVTTILAFWTKNNWWTRAVHVWRPNTLGSDLNYIRSSLLQIQSKTHTKSQKYLCYSDLKKYLNLFYFRLILRYLVMWTKEYKGTNLSDKIPVPINFIKYHRNHLYFIHNPLPRQYFLVGESSYVTSLVCIFYFYGVGIHVDY